jgi:hypothetical protein
LETGEDVFSKNWNVSRRILPSLGKTRANFSRPWKNSLKVFKALELAEGAVSETHLTREMGAGACSL